MWNRKNDKCTKLKGKIIINVTLIWFERTCKTIPFNSILEFSILSDFKVSNVIIWHWFIKNLVGTWRQNDVMCLLGICPPPPPPPPPPPQYSKHCRNYHVPRTELLNTVSQYQTPSLSLFLYGNDSFSLETNSVIFETVHKFILDSKRFWVKYYFGIKQAAGICVSSTGGTIALCAAVAANLHPFSHPQLLCFHSFITSLSLSLSLSHTHTHTHTHSFFFWLSLTCFLNIYKHYYYVFCKKICTLLCQAIAMNFVSEICYGEELYKYSCFRSNPDICIMCIYLYMYWKV